ncbi:hypothetical protein MNBD_CPR01-462 [hydrothermal vent metagenome]|uniref:VTT domain-containing protein n=1 Tax=hydrothermal vent metagenome TaxID=652676 RepID=A0A3B0UPX7_9ZZZZ
MHSISPFILHHLVMVSGSWWLLVPLIVLSTIFLEDITIALVGILAADHSIPVLTSLGALVLGIVIGDSLAYALGRLAIKHKFARKLIEHERISPLRDLLREHSNTTIFTTRFMPGFRLALYTACGFSLIPYYREFLPTSAMSAIVWSTTLFFLSFLFGFYTFHILGIWRWPVLLFILLGFLAVGHRYWKKMTHIQKVKTGTQN